jgi:hypothetical protein
MAEKYNQDVEIYFFMDLSPGPVLQHGIACSGNVAEDTRTNQNLPSFCDFCR